MPSRRPSAAHDQRGHVGHVGEDQERQRLVGHEPLAHPRAPQRPGGQHEAARAAGGEDPRGGQPGHRDLVARPPVDPCRARAQEDPAEHRDVAEEHPDPEQQRHDHPVRAAVLDPLPGVVEPGELRQQEVQRGDRQQQERAEREHAAAVDLEPVVVVRLGRLELERLELGVARGLLARAGAHGMRVAHALALRLEQADGAAQPPRERGGGGRAAADALGERRARRRDPRRSARRGRRARSRASPRRPRPVARRPRHCR